MSLAPIGDPPRMVGFHAHSQLMDDMLITHIQRCNIIHKLYHFISLYVFLTLHPRRIDAWTMSIHIQTLLNHGKTKKTMFPWVKSTFSMAKSNLFHLFPSFFHRKFPLFHLKKTTETAHLSAQLRRLSGLLGPQPLIAFSGVNQINGDFSQWKWRLNYDK